MLGGADALNSENSGMSMHSSLMKFCSSVYAAAASAGSVRAASLVNHGVERRIGVVTVVQVADGSGVELQAQVVVRFGGGGFQIGNIGGKGALCKILIVNGGLNAVDRNIDADFRHLA